jgi:CheY-like chemotaxis protein
MAPKKILVVEDNEDNREILAARLKRLGDFSIFTAGDGKEALEVAADARPDLIFMDLRMPVMDGYQAMEELRRTEWASAVPIVVVSAQSREEDRRRALAIGCNDFLPKPVTEDTSLQNLLRKYFG